MQISSITAGATLDLGVAPVSGYSAADGWALKVRLASRTAGGTAVTLTAVADGDGWRLQASATVTADWSVGPMAWAAAVVRGDDVVPVADGQTTVRPNPLALAAGDDQRSQARRALDDARAALAAWTPTRKRYKVGEREMEFNTPADIIKLITYWEQQVLAEDIQAGRTTRPARRIYSRI